MPDPHLFGVEAAAGHAKDCLGIPADRLLRGLAVDLGDGAEDGGTLAVRKHEIHGAENQERTNVVRELGQARDAVQRRLRILGGSPEGVELEAAPEREAHLVVEESP